MTGSTRSEPASPVESEVDDGKPQVGSPAIAVVLAWLLPGAGHLYLGRWGRAAIFSALILFSAVLGVYLEGKLFVVIPEQPLSRLGTIGSMAMGVPYGVLRWILGYEGNILAATYEYGSAFLLTAGLMNLLVVLDAWDIASGQKP